MKKVTIEEVRKVLMEQAWDANATKPEAKPVLVVYPNEVLLKLFGEEAMKKFWIPDTIPTSMQGEESQDSIQVNRDGSEPHQFSDTFLSQATVLSDKKNKPSKR